MSLSDVTRLYRWESKVDKTDDCWPWTGYRTASGYGMFRWDTGRRITAHRMGYLLFVGEIPSGYEIDHLCRNRGCVRPSHLQAVPISENRRRRQIARGSRTLNGRKTECVNGHPLSGDNLRVPTSGPQKRACRTCGREAMRRHRQRRRMTVA